MRSEKNKKMKQNIMEEITQQIKKNQVWDKIRHKKRREKRAKMFNIEHKKKEKPTL